LQFDHGLKKDPALPKSVFKAPEGKEDFSSIREIPNRIEFLLAAGTAVL
jgi:hypothetical protein